jgi:hypothetical protein
MCRKPPSAYLAGMTALGNFQPFDASGNIHQIARLKRLLHTLSRHFSASEELLLTTLSRQFQKARNRLEIAQNRHS